jgi:acetyl esterase/lipase
MKWSYDQYTANQKERDSIYVSPLHATVEQLRGLPTCLIQVAENDILRDDGLFVQAAAELVRHLTP